MTTVVLEARHIPDRGWRVFSNLHPGWRPPVTEELDRAAVERHFKSWQTRRTEFDWRVTPAAGDLEHLGFS